jgi:hypothetical protein
MSFRQFVTPHCHPASLDSASTPEAFAIRENELGSGFLTCTDHGTLAAAQQIVAVAKKHKLTPIVGLEGYFRDDACPILQRLGIPRTNSVPRGMDKDTWAAEHPDGSYVDYLKYQHITLGFMDYDAYLCAVRLLSRADARAERHGSERKPLFSWSEIEELASHNVTAMSSCFVPGTLVRTKNIGYQKIEEIKPGTEVLDQGKWVVVESPTSRSYDGEIARVWIAESPRPIECTSDHLFLVSVHNKDVWIKAGDLKRGDLVVTSCEKESSDKYWEDEDLWVLGLFLAEGSWGSTYGGREFGASLHFSLHINETYVVDRLRRWAEGRGFGFGLYGKKKTKSVTASVFSLAAAEWFGDIFGGRVHSDTKFIPQEIRELPIGKLRHLVAGYMRGDGHFSWRSFDHSRTGKHNVRRIVVASVSEALILDLSSILRRADLGFWISLSPYRVGKKDKQKHKEAFYLHASGADAFSFREWLNGSVVRDRTSGRTLSRVGKVQIQNYSGPVHCLSVPSRQFSLAGGAVVHNCLIGMVQRHLMQHQNTEAAEAYFQRLHQLFGDRFYVEIFPHVCSHNWEKKVAIVIEAEDGTKTTKSVSYTKKLRTDLNEPDGITAEELANSFNPSRHSNLVEMMNYRKWSPVEGPTKIVSVKKREGFFQNECTAFSPNGDLQKGCNEFVLEMSRKYGVKVIPSDDSHFATAEEKVVQDVRLAQQGDWRFHNSYNRQTSDDVWSYLQQHLPVPRSEFESWIENSIEWGGRFKGFAMDTTPRLPTKFFPSNSLQFTRELIDRYGRMEKRPEYIKRLRAEIEILHRNGKIDLLPYFHIDEDKCRMYENQGWITGPGRGSAAGLLLAYLLGITHIDPMKYGLSLERFITLDRIKSGKLPDIDQDLPFREPLTGEVTDVVEFEAEDGTKHIVPENLKVETENGIMTVLEAAASGADIKHWWLSEDKKSTGV